VLVDELDALLNKKQDVVYNLYNWASIANSGLVITGIANTMDLHERFQTKIASRLGHKRIIFAPYKRDDL
jgi:origin recognition complex subunit 1